MIPYAPIAFRATVMERHDITIIAETPGSAMAAEN
jgi:hypothetical protein